MSSPVLELLLARRSVPIGRLGLPGPTDAQIDTMLEAASSVPDHGHLQPWRFIVYQGPVRAEIGAKLATLAESLEGPLIPARRTQELTRLSRAPVVVAVVFSPKPSTRIPEFEMVLSAGAACMNLMLAAEAMEFGSNWVTNWYANVAQGRAILGLAADERIAGLIHIGTSSKGLPAPPRRSRAHLRTDFWSPTGITESHQRINAQHPNE